MNSIFDNIRKQCDLSKCVVYCDPPYANTAGYVAGAFDSGDFHEWMRWLMRYMQPSPLFVFSEYNMPSDFVCIKEIKHSSLLSGQGSHAVTEKLFVHESQLMRYKRAMAENYPQKKEPKQLALFT